jgi:hypothetical protein
MEVEGTRNQAEKEGKAANKRKEKDFSILLSP